VQYYLHSVLNSIGITKTIEQTTINGCLSIYNFVLAVGASFFVEKVGRRKLFLVSTSGMFLAFILWTTFAACKSFAARDTRITLAFFPPSFLSILLSLLNPIAIFICDSLTDRGTA